MRQQNEIAYVLLLKEKWICIGQEETGNHNIWGLDGVPGWMVKENCARRIVEFIIEVLERTELIGRISVNWIIGLIEKQRN